MRERCTDRPRPAVRPAVGATSRFESVAGGSAKSLCLYNAYMGERVPRGIRGASLRTQEYRGSGFDRARDSAATSEKAAGGPLVANAEPVMRVVDVSAGRTGVRCVASTAPAYPRRHRRLTERLRSVVSPTSAGRSAPSATRPRPAHTGAPHGSPRPRAIGRGACHRRRTRLARLSCRPPRLRCCR